MSASSSSSTPRGRLAVLGLCLVALALFMIPTAVAAADGTDVTPPSGTIGRPPSAEAGRPAAFSAIVQDEPGGSGIDYNSFVWQSSGFPNATGPSTSYTFPTAGTYSVMLTYRDLAGNATSVTVKVPVVADQSVLPPAGIPAPKTRIAATSDKKSVTVSIRGAITPVLGLKAVTGEPLLISTVCDSSVLLSVRKSTTTVATSTVDLVRKTCAYTKTFTIDRKRLGTATTLSLLVRFDENAAMRKTSKAFTVKIPKLPAIPKAKKKS